MLANIFGLPKDVFARANEYNLSDCAHYFLSNVKRLSDVGYVPTTQDILHTRVKTSGIVEVSQANEKNSTITARGFVFFRSSLPLKI